ncbi:MAG: rhodanese-like domain-containing protein [Planctomycetota bacterium]|jgi:rhodanese-related sulfurtransferase
MSIAQSRVEEQACYGRLSRAGGALLLTLAVAANTSCNRGTSDRDLAFVDPDEGQALVQGRQALFGLLGSSTGAWVDPRRETVFRTGHIPGAINIPFQNLEAQRYRLEGYGVLVVYGRDFRDPLAEGMSKRLIELGFGNVRTLRGGLRAWTDAGNPVETSEGETTSD